MCVCVCVFRAQLVEEARNKKAAQEEMKKFKEEAEKVTSEYQRLQQGTIIN